jgi:chromosome transmission fidelity protein 18
MADTFVATGLLGPGPSTSLLGSSPPADVVFLSNGLLGGLCVTPTHAQLEERARELEGIDEPSASEQAEKKNTFQPNGLLGSQDLGGCEQTCTLVWLATDT